MEKKKKEQNLKKFLRENWFKMTIGSILVLDLIVVYKYYKKLDKISRSVKDIAENTALSVISEYKNEVSQIGGLLKKRYAHLSEAEALVWPLKNIDPVASVTEIPGLSGWGSALRGAGLITVGDLIRFIRENGVESIFNIPGIGEAGYESIVKTIIRVATEEFKKIYIYE